MSGVYMASCNPPPPKTDHTRREAVFLQQRTLAETPTPLAGTVVPTRHTLRELTRLTRRLAKTQHPPLVSTCPPHLRDTLHAALSERRITVTPNGTLSV